MKKIIIILGTLLFFVMLEVFFIFKFINTVDKSSNINKIASDDQSFFSYVTDECIDEWKDYAEVVQNEIKETNNSLNDETRNYILIAEDNALKVYYINDKNEKILYKVTDISLEYLCEDDIEVLAKGVNVRGLENLNQMLEDFE